jgi:ubiquinone biosynthesis protein
MTIETFIGRAGVACRLRLVKPARRLRRASREGANPLNEARAHVRKPEDRPAALRKSEGEPLEAGWFVPARRLRRVAFVLGRHGFGALAARLTAMTPFGRLEAPAGARLGERIARVLADLGPTYIKLGQLLATREDLFPPEVTRALGRLHAHAPPVRPRQIARAIADALSADPREVFAHFDAEPLAAASIGQVHRAVLRSGEEVVIKVQRPGLAQVVAADLQLLRWLAALLSRSMPEVAALDPLALIDAFARSITSELDFRHEAENALELGRLLASAEEVRVPRIYPEYTRPTLLVMERVHGRRLDELDELGRQRARAQLLRAFSRQILDHGVFHADPHPGNVLIETDPLGRQRLVLIDLGALDAVDASLRAGLSRLVRAVALGRRRALCDAVLALSPDGATIDLDRARLERDLAELIAGASGRGTGAEVLGKMVAVGRNHHLRLSPSLVALVRALALLDGVLRGLDPARDLVADLRREWLISAARRLRRSLGGAASALTFWPRRAARLLSLPYRAIQRIWRHRRSWARLRDRQR